MVIIHTHLIDLLHALKIAHLVKYAGWHFEIQQIYIQYGVAVVAWITQDGLSTATPYIIYQINHIFN